MFVYVRFVQGYVYMCACMHILMCIECVWMYVCVHMCGCTCVCMYVGCACALHNMHVHICVLICMHVSSYVYVDLHACASDYEGR